MKRILLLCLICLLGVAPAFAAQKSYQTGIYVSGKVMGTYQTHKVTGYIDGESFGSLKDKDAGTFGGALAVGYDFYRDLDIHLRVELEYGINTKSNAKDTYYYGLESASLNIDAYETYKVDLGIQTAFFNVYYDFDTGTMFKPYIGAGIGLAFIESKAKAHLDINGYGMGASTGSKSTTNFAWNIGAGVGVDLTENVVLDAGYRFVSVGSAKTGTAALDIAGYGVPVNAKTKNIYLHQFYLGARYKF